MGPALFLGTFITNIIRDLLDAFLEGTVGSSTSGISFFQTRKQKWEEVKPWT